VISLEVLGLIDVTLALKFEPVIERPATSTSHIGQLASSDVCHLRTALSKAISVRAVRQLKSDPIATILRWNKHHTTLP
jgi:hypothetical protein